MANSQINCYQYHTIQNSVERAWLPILFSTASQHDDEKSAIHRFQVDPEDLTHHLSGSPPHGDDDNVLVLHINLTNVEGR